MTTLFLIMKACAFDKILEPIVWHCPLTRGHAKCARCDQYPEQRNPFGGMHRAETDPFAGMDLKCAFEMGGTKHQSSYHCGKMVTADLNDKVNYLCTDTCM